MPNESIQVGHARASGLVDVLDRVLDKGLVIAGDIKISIAEVELLTIRIRLMVCSIDKAEQIGLDWWRHDRHLSMGSDELASRTSSSRNEFAGSSGSWKPRRAPRSARRGCARSGWIAMTQIDLRFSISLCGGT